MKFSVFAIGTLSIALFFSSCAKDDEIVEPGEDYAQILNNTGGNVILKTYEALASEAADLQNATQALENNQDQTSLDAAKAAWVATRSPWEQSEGFLFGPVDQEGLDPSLDSWPVNVTDLNNVLNGSDALTAAFLAQQEGTLKGFHTVEFLLWGESGDKQVGDFTSREFEYLAAASEVLNSDAQELYDLWKPTGGNYIDHVLSAGSGSNVYVSQKSALEEMTNALIVIADEVGNGKINDPFAQQDLTLEESRFSANSKADFADNMRSIKNIYTGVFGVYGNGNSLSDLISAQNSTLDTQVLSAIDESILSIESIPGTFSEAVFNNPNAVADAQTAVRDLQQILEEDVLPIVSGL